MTLATRSYEKEMLDGGDIPVAEIARNLQELDTINTWLGGHRVTLSGFRTILQEKKSVTVCEIGCGGGDNLRAIAGWCRKNDIRVSCIGIDRNPDCIGFANARLDRRITNLITSDYQSVKFGSPQPDIIFSSLLCHHFTNEELVGMLQWMHRHAGTGFFINDLHRHPLAYWSIKLLTKIFSRSRLVKNDAPLSVKRGFRRSDWESLLQQAGIGRYSLQWKWAFRWLVTVDNRKQILP